MTCLKYFYLFIFSFVNITAIFAQNNISLFLSSANQQKTVQFANQQVEVQAGQDVNLPWLQKFEFRTETNDFIWTQQEYAIRATPNTKRQRNAQQSYHQAIGELSKTEQEIVLKNALFNRYEWLVKWLEIEQKISDKAALKLIYEDKLTVLKRSVSDLDFKIKDLITAEEELLEIETDILTLKAEQRQLSMAFQYLTGNNNMLELDKNLILTTKQILNKMNLLPLDSLNDLSLERLKNRIEILDKETEIELSKINNPISYLQLKAGGNNNETFQEFVSVGVGVQLPLKGDKKLDLNELALEKLAESGEYFILKEKLEHRQKEIIATVNALIMEQDFLDRQLKNSQAVFVLSKLLETADANPLDILDLKELILKKEQKIKQIDFEILKNYVDWLAVSNTMMQRPLRNHLVAELDILPIEN